MRFHSAKPMDYIIERDLTDASNCVFWYFQGARRIQKQGSQFLLLE